MLLVLRNLRVESTTITVHTGENVVLAPQEYLIVECPENRFSYYQGLIKLGFNLVIRKSYVHCTTKILHEDTKPVEETPKKKAPKFKRALTQKEQEEYEYGVIPVDALATPEPEEKVEEVKETEELDIKGEIVDEPVEPVEETVIENGTVETEQPEEIVEQETPKKTKSK